MGNEDFLHFLLTRLGRNTTKKLWLAYQFLKFSLTIVKTILEFVCIIAIPVFLSIVCFAIWGLVLVVLGSNSLPLAFIYCILTLFFIFVVDTFSKYKHTYDEKFDNMIPERKKRQEDE